MKRKKERYIIMEGSKQLGLVSALCPRSLHKKMVELLASEYIKHKNIRVVRYS